MYEKQGLLLITPGIPATFIFIFAFAIRWWCRMQIANFRRASSDLVFRFCHGETGAVHAEGRQTVVFADKIGPPIRMPAACLLGK